MRETGLRHASRDGNRRAVAMIGYARQSPNKEGGQISASVVPVKKSRSLRLPSRSL